MNPFKTFIFAAGAAVAAFVTAYFVGAFDRAPAPQAASTSVAVTPSQPQATTSEPGAPAGTPEAPKPAEPPATAAPAPTATSPSSAPTAEPQQQASVAPAPETATGAAPVQPEQKPAVVAPTFDLLRVEGDGSIVIAGKAEPNADVEVINGATSLGRTKAGPGGDFAIVLDQPLKPGEHQLVLRSTSTSSSNVVSSPETAVVSIPDQPGGQVLALVEAPGKPSALITVPRPDTAGQQAAVAPATGEGAAAATGTDAGTADAPAAASAEPSPSAPASGTPASAAQAQVRVEAVEIEGRQIFVAGRAEPGKTVRVYANDQLLGEAKAGPDGNFLVEATRDLKVGDYIIRADMLSRNGAEVTARAAVPFQREAGETMSAVAPRETASASSSAPAPSAEAPAAGAPSGSAEAVAEEPAEQGSSAAPTGASTAGSASSAPAQSTETAAASASGSSASAAVTGARLEKVEGAVIIRRGDSLWRISRRVYGRGVRYSTIYLANQDQIRDPDLILPGQVFRVPDATAEGEPANLDAMGGQATKRSVE